MRNSESKSGLDFYCIFGRFDFFLLLEFSTEFRTALRALPFGHLNCVKIFRKNPHLNIQIQFKREFVQTKLHLLSKTDPFFVQQDANLQQLKNIKIPQKRKKYNYALRKTTKVFCLCKN